MFAHIKPDARIGSIRRPRMPTGRQRVERRTDAITIDRSLS
jgi:hypothetical protein